MRLFLKKIKKKRNLNASRKVVETPPRKQSRFHLVRVLRLLREDVLRLRNPTDTLTLTQVPPHALHLSKHEVILSCLDMPRHTFLHPYLHNKCAFFFLPASRSLSYTNNTVHGEVLSLSSQSGCHVLSDGVSSLPADEPVEPLKPFLGLVGYVLGLPGSAVPLINAAWVPT